MRNVIVRWRIAGAYIKYGTGNLRKPGDEDVMTEYEAKKYSTSKMVEVLCFEDKMKEKRTIMDAGSILIEREDCNELTGIGDS